ncbi:hemerythrin domain-containing protein [Thiofilum flexile]|uniref:hemerythrin domain-containing protein n=1 Tax=Thiofilum flexile TaxID=125627 RepID=UPI0003729C55|nr:hemerythrin domain-containing protein [Thiofilum flexile]
MHKILAGLHQDHINLAHLLGLLEEQVKHLAAGDDANLSLILDIADYIGRYSDYVHHPKEDKVYEVLTQCTAEGADTVTTLLTQHHQLPQDTLSFQALIQGVLYDDAIVLRDDLVSKINTFIRAQKQHMDLEEGIVFPLINANLKPKQWSALEDIILNDDDPLFGAKVLERYEQLYAVLNARVSA